MPLLHVYLTWNRHVGGLRPVVRSKMSLLQHAIIRLPLNGVQWGTTEDLLAFVPLKPRRLAVPLR